MSEKITFLNEKSKEVRREVLKICSEAGYGHITSTFSCVELMTALYYGCILKYDPKNPKWDGRDRFILSKGHAVIGLYYILADLGYFPKEELKTFGKEGARLAMHPSIDIEGVENKSGSLGHGLGIAAGIAYALKKDNKLPLVVCMLGDAECYEGSVWESAMFVSHNRLNNLIAIIDRNWMGATGFTEEMVALEPMDKKWEAFGWQVMNIDGHDIRQILEVFKGLRSRKNVKPLMIIADTVKGKGVSFICHQPLWHMSTPVGEEAKKGLEEIESAERYTV